MIAVVAALAWVAAAYRVPSRHGRTASAWALLGSLVALAAALTVKVPPVRDALGGVVGVPDLAQLLMDIGVVVSGCGAQLVLLYLLVPEAGARAPVRRRLAAVATAIVAMTVSFGVATHPPGGVGAVAAHLADPGLLEFRLAYLAFLGWAFGDVARLCVRFAALSGGRLLATGLRIIAAGCLAGLGYVAACVLEVVAAAGRDPGLLRLAEHLAEPLIAVGALLVLAGSTLPAVGPRLGLREDSSDGSDAAGLDALWRAVTRALPEVVLPTGRGSEAERLYRQVIEVEDARLSLRPLRDAVLEQAAALAVRRHGIDHSEQGAAAEGVALALAVDRLRAAHPAPAAPGAPTATAALLPGPAAAAAAGGGPTGGLDAEVAWLSAVGRWYSEPALTATARSLLATSNLSRQDARR